MRLRTDCRAGFVATQNFPASGFAQAVRLVAGQQGRGLGVLSHSSRFAGLVSGRFTDGGAGGKPGGYAVSRSEAFANDVEPAGTKPLLLIFHPPVNRANHFMSSKYIVIHICRLGVKS